MRAYRTFQALILAGLGLFMLERIWSGRIGLYINRRSIPIVLLAALGLVILAQVVFQARARHSLTDANQVEDEQDPAHAAPGRANLIWLVIPIVIGLVIPARPLGAGALVNRGINTASALVARSGETTSALDLPAPQRNVLDWIRAFQAAADPLSLNGELAEVTGFVYHDRRLPPGQFMLGRFTITCCVADAMAVGMVVRWADSAALPENRWVTVRGPVQVLELEGQKVPMISAEKVELIPEPEQPYLYP
jgi:putative membrane protein